MTYLMTREVDKLNESFSTCHCMRAVNDRHMHEPLFSTVAAKLGDIHRHATGLKHAKNHCSGAFVWLGVGPPTWHLS